MMLPGDLEAEDRLDDAYLTVPLSTAWTEELYPIHWEVKGILAIWTDDIGPVVVGDSGVFHTGV